MRSPGRVPQAGKPCSDHRSRDRQGRAASRDLTSDRLRTSCEPRLRRAQSACSIRAPKEHPHRPRPASLERVSPLLARAAGQSALGIRSRDNCVAAPSQGTRARRAQARAPRGAGGPHAFISPSHGRSTGCRPAEQSRDWMPDADGPHALRWPPFVQPAGSCGAETGRALLSARRGRTRSGCGVPARPARRRYRGRWFP
jgi:hypothetical protein